MDEFQYELKIPKARVAVLIGTEGEVKRRLESETTCRIKVDSQEGDIFVTGKDALMLYTAREIITAIGRGFNPDIAFSLLSPDAVLEVINIADFARNKNDEMRLKGRVIGAEGKARRLIEEITETSVCVFGKTISIIGQAYNVSLSRRALISLLSGSPHANVYKWLEKQRRLHRSSEMRV